MSMVLAHNGEEDQDSVGNDRNQLERRMKPTVMIVEDEEALLTLLQYNLDKEGYNVVTVADGEEAVLMIRTNGMPAIGSAWIGAPVTGALQQARAASDSHHLHDQVLPCGTG